LRLSARNAASSRPAGSRPVLGRVAGRGRGAARPFIPTGGLRRHLELIDLLNVLNVLDVLIELKPRSAVSPPNQRSSSICTNAEESGNVPRL
jgi:hypothetical protein